MTNTNIKKEIKKLSFNIFILGCTIFSIVCVGNLKTQNEKLREDYKNQYEIIRSIEDAENSYVNEDNGMTVYK